MPRPTRILVAECKQEVSTFNPVLSHWEDFSVLRGEAILRYHRGKRSEIGGALAAFAPRPDLEIVPTFAARQITSAGTLAGADWRRIAREFLQAVKAALPADGIYFSLHGAMASQVEDDPEGYLLAETRQLVGPDVPIVASTDLHGILTDRMLESCDALTMFHTYPHVDFYETGERAGRLLLRILFDHVKPVTAKVAIPALVRGDQLITATGLFGRCIRAAQAIEQSPGGLVAGMFIGNPFTDVPELQTYTVVTTDGDAPRAEREAIKIARQFWKYHEKMRVPLTSVAESVRLAAETPGTTGLVDAADATSSGASGDSNAILREMIRAGYNRKALMPIVDAPAVAAAIAAGVGGKISVRLGGSLDPARFKPLAVKGIVRLISDGRFFSESFRDSWYAGNSAVIDIGTITVVATSRAVSLYDRSLFLAHGQDPRYFDSVVIKSPHTEHHMFEAWCTRLINVDGPGATSADVRQLGHAKCPRPIFPLDETVPFVPVAKLFGKK